MERSGRVASVAVGCLFVLCAGSACCGGALLWGWPAFVSARVREQLSAHGIECDERMAASFDPFSRELTLRGPTTCTIESGAFARAELIDAIAIATDGERAQSVRGGQLRLWLRDAQAIGGGPMLLQTLGVGPQIGALAWGLSELSSQTAIPLDFERLELALGEEPALVLEHASIDGAEPRAVEIGRLTLTVRSIVGGGQAVIEPLTGSVGARELEVRGELQLSAQLPVVGRVEQRMPFRLQGRNLDGPSAEWSLGS